MEAEKVLDIWKSLKKKGNIGSYVVGTACAWKCLCVSNVRCRGRTDRRFLLSPLLCGKCSWLMFGIIYLLPVPTHLFSYIRLLVFEIISEER